MAIKDDAFFLAVGAVTLIGLAWYLKNKVGGAVSAAGTAVSDASVSALPSLVPGGGAISYLYKTLTGDNSNGMTTAATSPQPLDQNFGITNPSAGW